MSADQIRHSPSILVESRRFFNVNEQTSISVGKSSAKSSHGLNGSSRVRRREERKYGDNKVTTTKYTYLSFLPKNLMVQFSKMANAYFLIIMVLQLLPGLAQKYDWIFTLLPLIMVVGVSMVKDFYEDNKRRRKDREENRAPVMMCSNGEHTMQ